MAINGNVNNHLGGHKAARTKATNDHLRQFGYPTYNDKDAEQKRITRPIIQSSRSIQPPPKIIDGKQICPVCREPVSIWGFGAHYNMKHVAKKSTGGKANDNPAADKSVGAQLDAPDVATDNNEPASTIPTINNNITIKPATHQNCVNSPKFEIGDRVRLNGFPKNAIRTDYVEREIVGAIKMQSGWFYKATNGTNTKGKSYHCYPERRLTMLVPAQPAIPNTIPSPPSAAPTPQSKILAFPFPNVRTRRYNPHPGLQANTIPIRTRY